MMRTIRQHQHRPPVRRLPAGPGRLVAVALWVLAALVGALALTTAASADDAGPTALTPSAPAPAAPLIPDQTGSGQAPVAQNPPPRDIGACPSDLKDIPTSDTRVRVVKVAGLLDPVVQENLLSELRGAEQSRALGLVIWMNSKGSVLGDEQYAELANALATSPIPILMWVGQSGAQARGGAAELLGVADIVGVSPGSTVGATGPARIPATALTPAWKATAERLRTATVGSDEAIQLGLSIGPTDDVATIGPFVTHTPGFLAVQCHNDDGSLRTVPVSRAELSGLPLSGQLFHTVSSPEVAYLLFVMGLGLLLFELFTAGIGVAGAIAAVFVALGSFGLANLPARWWAIGLLILAFLAMAVDIQTNVPRFYTAVGVGLFTIGTFTLYSGVQMSWLTVIVGLIGVLLYAYGGMPSIVRTRFSTPTIGRRWMIGEMGEAITDVAPEGTVKVRDVAWRAITNRATPVKAGDPVRVVGLDRLVLEIEPEEGGAKDYRERR